MKCIGISGTPGTGKTSVAKELSYKLQIPYLDLNSYVLENKLYIYYDRLRDSYVIDEDKIRDRISDIYREQGPLIIASHYIEVLPKDLFELVIILRRDPNELINVLKQRGWPDYKIAENVEAELLSICTLNAVEELGEEIVVEIDATSKAVADVANEIIDVLYGLKPVYHGFRIDWISTLTEEKLDEILKYIEINRRIDIF